MKTMILAADGELIQRVGWVLVHSLWVGTLVISIIGLLLKLMDHRSAQVRYLLGWATLIVIGASLPLAIFIRVPENSSATPPAPLSTQPPVQSPVGQGTPISTPPSQKLDSANRQIDLPGTEESGDTPAVVQNPSPVPETDYQDRRRSPNSQQAIENMLPWISGGWLVGIAILALWHLCGISRLRTYRRKGLTPVPSKVRSMFNSLCRGMGIKATVGLWQSDRIPVPALIGGLHPIILLPARVLTGLTPEQLEALLAHELAHLRRHDHWFNLLQITAETLLFFHPAVWWLSRRIREERENCCDDIALENCPDRKNFATALMRVAEIHCGEDDDRLAMAASGHRRSTLLARIRRIAEGHSELRSGTTILPNLITICAVLAVSATCMTMAVGNPDIVANEKHAPNDSPILPVTEAPEDPLPDGALARIGSLRMRQEGTSGTVQFSPNGKYLVSWGNGPIEITEVASGETHRRSSHEQIKGGRLRNDGALLAIARQKVKSIGATTEDLITFDNELHFPSAAISPNGLIVATGLRQSSPENSLHSPTAIADGSLRCWNIENGALMREFRSDIGSITGLAFAQDGIHIASAGERGIDLWNLRTGNCLPIARFEKDIVGTVAFSPDSKRLATATYGEGIVSIWHVESGKKAMSLPIKEFGTRTVAFAPDGRIAHGGEAGIIHVWSPDGATKVQTITAGYNIHSVAFSPNDNNLAASMALFLQRKTRLWDLETGEELHAYPRHEQRIETLEYARSGKALVTASVDQTVRVWDPETGGQHLLFGENTPTDERAKAPPIAVSPDTNTILIGRGDTVQFHDLATGEETLSLKSAGEHVFSLAFTQDNKSFLELSRDREVAPEATDHRFHYHTVRLRDRAGGRVQLEIGKLDDSTKNATISPDGRWIITIAADVPSSSTIDIWSTETKKRVRTLNGFLATFSPDNKHLAIESTEGHAKILEVGSWKELHDLGQHYWHQALRFSPDGKHLALGSTSSSPPRGVEIYEASSGNLIWKNVDLVGSVHAVAFSPDGSSLAATDHETSALVLRLPR